MNEGRAKRRLSLPFRKYRRLRSSILLMAAAIIAAIWATVGVLIWQQHQSTLARARDDTANLALAFEAHISQSLASLDQLSQLLDRSLLIEGQNFDLPDWAKRSLAHNALIIQISIADKQGLIRQNSSGPVVPPIDISDREHFQVHLRGNSDVLFVAKPLSLRSNGRWAIPISHRIAQADGTFGGVSAFFLDPEYFVQLYDSVDVGANGVVALVGLDGTVRARAGEKSNSASVAVGSSIGQSDLLAEIRAVLDDTTESVGPFDQVRRIYSYRRVSGYPLTVLVGYGRDEVLAATWASARWILAGTVLATGLLAVLALYLVVEITRRTRHEQLLLEKQAHLAEANSELERSKIAAEAANVAKSAFLANMSHELRTPLNAILGFSEIIGAERFGSVGNPRYVEYANDIHESGQHLLDIISDILDLAKIEAGKLDLHEEDFAIEPMLDACFRFVSGRAATGNVGLAKRLVPALPMLRGDLRQLRQVLTNLLSNAVKFTPPGGSVTVSVAPEVDGWLAIQIGDTGIGMAATDIPIALTAFGQLDSGLNRKYEGTGLGLPLAKALVEIHGGRLELTSIVGSGTTVTVKLPPHRVLPQSGPAARDIRAAE